METASPFNYPGDMAGSSPLEEALSVVGERWTLLLVEALLEGSGKFGELQTAVEGIATNVLSDRLKKLERGGLVRAVAYSERPPRFRYELTAAGRELAGALRLLADWGARRSDRSEPVRHSVCGTALEAKWYCPTCSRPVDEEEAPDLRFA